MSKTEILAELSKLTPEERQEVRLRLAELDHDDWLDDGALTDKEKSVIEERFRDMDARPDVSIAWDEAKAHLTTRSSR
jgi:DNA-directed RNA polymerase sigma subunit (sigma70/sigma32)